MPFNPAILEEFFESKFEPSCSSPDELRELVHFDGFVQWHVWLVESKQYLGFRADDNVQSNAFPALEIEVCYSDSDVRISFVPTIGTRLLLRPQGCTKGANLLAITKTLQGKISFATTLGETADNELDNLSKDWFEGRD